MATLAPVLGSVFLCSGFAQGALFNDNFTRATDPGPLTPWQTNTGNWTVTGGHLVAQTNVSANYDLAYVTNTWTNYAVQCQIQFPTPSAFGGGIGACLNPATGTRYSTWVYPENSGGGSRVLRLVKWQGWTSWAYQGILNTPIAQVTLPSVGTNWHTLKLATYTNQLSAYYDGVLVLTARDAEAQPYLVGGISAEAWTGSDPSAMLISNVTVTPLVANGNYSVQANTMLSVPAPGVLVNDTEVLGTNLSAFLVNGPANGTLNLSTNGGFTYMPATNHLGIDSFVYQANDGTANLGTATVTITVSPIHNGPSLPIQTNRVINELTQLTLTNTPTDNDVPPPVLTYVLVPPSPANATIDLNGVITWTPQQSQSPSTNTIRTVVTDNGSPALSATNSFTVIVREVNMAPVLGVIPTQTINELTLLTVTNSASEPNIHSATIGYRLLSAPAGMSINANGVVTWTPSQNQSPSTNTVTTVVTNSNPYDVLNPQLTATNSFTVIVREVNVAPVLGVIPTQTINELTLLTVTNSASEPNIHSVTIGYGLLGAPAGMTIDANGVITWTPAQNQSPSINTVTTVVTNSNPYNSVNPQLTATNTFSVIVREVNVAPVLGVVPTQTINALTLLTVTNSASEPNIHSVTVGYGLLGAPAGMTINTNGVITWTPTQNQSPSTNTVTTVVTNSNPYDALNPQLTAANSFTVIVAQIVAQGLNVAVQPPAQVILPGSIAIFTASATGSGPFGYQWQFNKTTLLGQTNASLALTNAQLADSGTYSIVVTNSSNAVTSSASLFVVTDPQLKVALSSSLSSTNLNLLALTNLWARNFEITNLSGIAGATNLVLLDLAGNSISDLTPLQGLRNLRYLNLDANAITNISPLTGLTNLASFSLARNYLLDYSPLSNLTNLSSLSLQDGALTSLGSLSNLFQLRELNVYHNNFADLSPLKGLTNLTSLDLRWNALTNPGVLSSLTNFSHLSQLFLAGTALTNIDFIQQLTQLTSLNLAENSITNLSPLLPLTNLQYLTLSWNNSLPNDTYTNLSAMTGLVSLELRGDGLTDVGFLSNLGHLTYADLAVNNLSDLSPLSQIPNLNVVLDANTNLNCSKLASMSNIVRIWLNGCSLTNVDFLNTMTQLKALGLEQNSITHASPLTGLTNLSLLGLSQCTFTNYDWIAALPRLESLRLDGNGLSNYPAPSSLSFLSLNDNRLSDLSALTSLTNLSSVYLTYNRVCDISTLADLPALRFLDAGHNLDSVTPAQSTANLMRGHWVSLAPASLSYLPMDQLNMSLLPPVSPTWYIPTGRTRTLNVYVNDLVVPAPELSITASSLPLIGVPLTLTNSIIGTNAYRTITVTPAAGQTGTVTNVLVASDSTCGLTSTLNIETHVVAEDDAFSIPSVQLSNALWFASSQPTDGLTSADLLNLTSFSATSLGLSSVEGLQWGKNLSILNLSANGLHDISPLEGLTNLTSLALDSNPLTNTEVLGSLTGLRFLSLSGASNIDITFLIGLTNLQSLDLGSSLVTNLNTLAGLTSLTTLNLADDVLTNISFLTNLPGLLSLNISSDKLTDISPLGALTNLSTLYLQQNRLTNISVLTNLHHLSYLNIQLNLLGPNANGSLPILQNQVANLVYPPQRSPPSIDVRTNWVIAPGTNFLTFTLSDTGPEGEILKTSATSSNPGLTCGMIFTGVDDTWTLNAFAQPSAVGTNVVTLSATNDVGLSTNVAVTVEVIASMSSGFSQLSGTNLAWTTSGDKPWLMQSFVTFQGQPAAQSGGIGNSQNSVLQCTNLVGPGRLTFWWRVSSESNFDWFEFDLGNRTNRISGEVGWQRQVVPVPPGLQTAQWRYYKDANTSAGLDAGFLAQVTFEPGIWLEITRRPTNGNGQCVLTLHGVPGQLYEVQVCTNLSHSPGKTNWFPLAPTIVVTNLSVRYTDMNANSTVGLYRLHSLGEPNVWLELTGRPINGQCVLTLHTFPGLPYQVLAATNLSSPAGITSWFALSPSIVSTSSLVSFTDTNANSSVRFYRLSSAIQP